MSEEKEIHDWYEYAGKLIDKRKIDAERKRMSRGQPTKGKGQSSCGPEDIRRTTAKSSEDGAGNRTLPYLTVPNRTIYSGGGDDARERYCESTDFEDYEDECVESLVENSSQHYQTLKDIKSLPADVKDRFYKTIDLLYKQYWGKQPKEFDYTLAYKLICWVHFSKEKGRQPLNMSEDDIELLTHSFNASAMADTPTLSYVTGVFKRFRERGIQSADEFWDYETKRDEHSCGKKG